MATKSFIKDLIIDNEKDAVSFVCALEKAEANRKEQRKKDVKSREVKDKGAIRKLFGV